MIARTLIDTNAKQLHHVYLQENLYRHLMYRKLHVLKYFIDSGLAVPVTQVAIGSDFGKPFR